MERARDVDIILIEEFKRGDADAFDALFLRHRGRLLRLLTRLAKEKSIAEELVQETFVKVYFALPQFRGDSAFFTWLCRIAINTFKNHMAPPRRSNFLGQFDTAGLPSPSVSMDVDSDTPASILEGKQTLAELLTILTRMEMTFSTPLMMYELDGMTYLEIASAINCPVGTVRSRIARGRSLIAAKIRL